MPDPEPQALPSCAEALELVQAAFAGLAPPPVETVPLADALGRVLAQTIHADRDQPPFPRSTRDGYALRAGDTGPITGTDTGPNMGPDAGPNTGPNTGPDTGPDTLLPAMPPRQARLQVVGGIRAGEPWTGADVGPGQAVEIMTGAPVPHGADAVLMIEFTAQDDGGLLVQRPVRSGENIVPQGAEARSGQALLRPGVRIGPAEIALAASVGAARIAVYAKPVVAILSTGDEVVALDETPGRHQIRNSNAHALAALVRQNCGEPRLLPVAADTREALERAVDQARGDAMLILSGGVSAGKYDLVEPVLLSRGAEFLFTGVRMQPGKPAVFGRVAMEPHISPAAVSDVDRTATQWIFGLPGNPVSTQVTAMLFAIPMLRAIGGETDPKPAFASAELIGPVRVSPGLTRFLPARLTATLQRSTVEPTGWQGSGDLHSNARANCYLVVPPEATELDKRSIVRVLLR